MMGKWASMSAGGKDKKGEKTGKGKKKGGLPLDSPLNLTGTKATRTNLELGASPVTKIDPNRLQVQLPTTARVAVGMADVIAGNGPTATALADLGHRRSLPDWKPCSERHCITRQDGWQFRLPLSRKGGQPNDIFEPDRSPASDCQTS